MNDKHVILIHSCDNVVYTFYNDMTYQINYGNDEYQISRWRLTKKDVYANHPKLDGKMEDFWYRWIDDNCQLAEKLRQSYEIYLAEIEFLS